MSKRLVLGDDWYLIEITGISKSTRTAFVRESEVL